MNRPAVTTRPLFWLAHEHGADYTDVLLVAEGFRCASTGQPIRTVWVIPALERLSREISRVDGKRVLDRILAHVREFMALQGTPSTLDAPEAFGALYARMRQHQGRREPEFPDDPHCRDV